MSKVTTDPGIGAAPEERIGDTVPDGLPSAIEPLPVARYRTSPNAGEPSPEHELLKRVKPAKKPGLKSLRLDPLGDARKPDVQIVQRDEALKRIAEETAEEVKAKRVASEGGLAPAGVDTPEDKRKRIIVLAFVALFVGLGLILLVRSLKGSSPELAVPSATAQPTAPARTIDSVPPVESVVSPPPSVTASASAASTMAAPSASAKEPKAPHRGAIGPSTSEPPAVAPVPIPSPVPSSAEPAGSAPNPWKIKEH